MNNDKSEKLTERARKTLALAQEEAQRFNHNYIGTEHLLLGLLREEDGVAAQVLTNLNVELNKVRSAVEFIIGRGDRIVIGEVGLSPRAAKVIEFAANESQRLKHHYIGTEHLLLGLVGEGEGIAAGVLESLGVNLEKVRAETIRVLADVAPRVQVRRTKSATTPTLDQVGTDLTIAALSNNIDPIVGREAEVERVVQILTRRQKNNPVLIGEPGVGKAAIVMGLAQKIISGEVPETLLGKHVIALDAASLVAGATRIEFEERLKKIIEEVKLSQEYIIFIDEVHTLVGAGASTVEGMMDVAYIIKPALGRGEIQCIGTTTLDEYRKYIEKDPTLQRAFQDIAVRELGVEETIQILKGMRPRFEEHHRLTISDDALQVAVDTAQRRRGRQSLLNQSIDMIDESASRVRMLKSLFPFELKEAMRGLEAVLREKDEAIQNAEYDRASELRGREVKLRYRISKLESGLPQRHRSDKYPTVTAEDIATTAKALSEPSAISENSRPRRIFISYRRQDSADATGRIDDQFVETFGREAVFKDTDSMPIGKDFRRYLDESITSADVVLIIIGLSWLAVEASGLRRIDSPEDFVRYEIEKALNLDKPIIPVLVQGATLPKKDDLPESIQNLSFREGTDIRSDSRFHQDVQHLIVRIQRLFAADAPQ